MEVFVSKGMRVFVQALVAQRTGTHSLAGAQMKVSAQHVELTGTIAHVRGDHPTAPTNIGVWIAPDDASGRMDNLFVGLEVQPKFCFACNRYEVGPFAQSAVKALIGSNSRR